MEFIFLEQNFRKRVLKFLKAFYNKINENNNSFLYDYINCWIYFTDGLKEKRK